MARHYLAALAFVLGATGVRVVLDPYLGEAPGLSIFLLAVLGSAWIGGLGPAILALVSGALIADFWFVEPRNDLGTREPRVLVAFIGYVIMGLGIAGAVFLERRSRKRAEADYQSARLRAADLERRDSDAETRFRMLADSVPVLLWMSGPQKHRSYFNRQWLEFRGRTLDEEEADGWLEGVHPLDLGAIEECKRAFAERTAFQAQFRLKRHDGEYRWVIDSGVPRYSPDGSFLGFSGGSIDITDLKESEAERQVLLEKLTVLVEVSSTLISSLDLGDTLPRILALASRVVAADAFAMWRFLPDEDRWRIIASEGLSERYQDEAVRAVSHLRARLESPLVVEDLDREESLAAQRDIQHAEGIVSLLAMPLRILGESNGTLVFYYRSRHTFSEVELRTATAMANLAAASIDSALLHETTERARVRAERAAEQVARLQRITEALSDACTSSEVCDVAVEEGMAALGASQGAAGLVTPDGEALEVVCAIGYRDEVVRSWRRVPIHAPLPPADAARTGEIVFLETAEQRITRYPFLAQVPGLDTDASVCVPLLVQGRVLGVVAFGFERETSFSSEDRSFLLALGRHCAQALERARLYDVEQQARAAAEEANRSKDAFLAMLAHELRNPLVPLWNGLELLHRPAALSAEELERAKETMRRQMRHLARLIEDLLDVSRLTSGKILLRPEPSDLTELIRTVAEDMKGIFEPAEVDLIIRIPDVPVWVRVDRTRISQ
ncbi:MAG TPA: GAF domain-containing protein, partial [Planctomycetota bacterium]|nr:GAF domain-containing protein [Planctomycetota bacterium]